MTLRLKRRAAPRTWTIPRKGTRWVLRPRAGPHPQDQSMPLLHVLRDLRKIVRTTREARLLVNAGQVRVDGEVVHDLARGIGLMDTVSLAAPLDEHYRVVKNARGKLVLVAIPPNEAGLKIGRIRSKQTVRGGRVQMTLHDGRNLLVAPDSEYHVGDTIKMELPGQKVLDHLPLAPGRLAFVSGGSHVGQLAHVDRIEVRNSSQPNLVHFKEGFATTKQFVFVVGESAPILTLTAGATR
ncbi:MAG: 30S ribosomal protein S4e [Thermoplasmata archaeon]